MHDQAALALFHAPFPTIVCDFIGQILYANPAAIVISGRKESELTGKAISEVFVGEGERADFRSAFARSREIREDRPALVVTVAEFGNPGKPFQVRLRSVDTPAGKQVVLYAVDLQIEGVESSGLKNALDLARHESRAKSEFLAMMSHEIRTPLTGVMGILEMLKISLEEPKLLRLVDTARESADSLLQILSDVLDLSKMNAAGVKFREADFEIRPMLQSILEAVELQAGKRKNTLSVAVMQDVPEYLFGDSGRLRQVIMNLVTNAIKFTEDGKIDVAVRLIRKQQERVVIRCEVCDTGVGIPLERQGELFQDFSTLHPTFSRQFGGIGLGLSICKRIVSAAGGAIGAASNPGEGSFFWFTMPFREVSARVPAHTESSAQAVTPPSQFKRGRVLIVDDNVTNRLVMRAYLEHAGYTVDDVAGAEAAIDGLRRGDQEYACILMDLAMPGMDGLQAVQAIRSSKSKFSDIPVIGITAFDQGEQHQAMLRSGMDAVLSKPINREQLVHLVSRHFGGTGLSNEIAGVSTSALSQQKLKANVVLEETVLRELKLIVGLKGVQAIIDTWLALLDRVVSRVVEFGGTSAEMTEISQLGHKLAGSSGQVGAFQIQARALALEAACRRSDSASVLAHLSKLAQEGSDVKSRILLLLTGAD